jgi:hypothetical protein
MNSLLEVPADVGKLGGDLADCVAQALLYGRAGALGSAGCSALTAARGSPLWNVAETEQVLRDTGYVDVKRLPPQPGPPVIWIVARKV